MNNAGKFPIAAMIGALFIAVAVFAVPLGLDNDAGWGGGRALILEAGIALLVLEAFLRVFESPLRKISGRMAAAANAIGRDRAIIIVFAGMSVLTAFAYLWLLRDKNDASRIHNYYGELARAFRRGNLYLSQAPSAQLLALENPYDPALRKQAGVEDFPWDVSLYEGRFYIYWGPTPAALLAPFSDETLASVEDFHIAFICALGLFMYSAWTAASFWRAFKRAPVWVFAVLLLVLGFSVPVTTMLKRGEVYEAAIFACQFFFIGGCYWAYSALQDETPPAWKFALASAHWALAVGARTTVLPAIAVAALVMILPLLRDFRGKNLPLIDSGQRLRLLLAAGIPLLAGVSALAWYNHARFGSIFEFGIRYQLANVDYIQFRGSFGLKYLSGNLKTYFLHPVGWQSRFPFVTMTEYAPSNDRLAGLSYAAPSIALILLSLFRAAVAIKDSAIATAANRRALALFAGAGIVSAAVIFLFYFIALRYALDFLPSAWLLIALSLGLEFESLQENRVARGALSSIFVLLALTNATMGVLLAIPDSGTAFMLNFLNALGKLLGLR